MSKWQDSFETLVAYSIYLPAQCSEPAAGPPDVEPLSPTAPLCGPHQVSLPLWACCPTWKIGMITTHFKELWWGVVSELLWSAEWRARSTVMQCGGFFSALWCVLWNSAAQGGGDSAPWLLGWVKGVQHFCSLPIAMTILSPFLPLTPSNHQLAFCLCGFTCSGYFIYYVA